MILNSIASRKSTIFKWQFLPAIIVTLSIGFNNKAFGKEIAANSKNQSLMSEVSEMNRRSIVSVSGRQTQEIIQAVNQLIKEYNKQDIEGIMSNIDPNAPDFDKLEESLEYGFKKYEYDISINNIKFVEVSQERAKIELSYDMTMRPKNQILTRTFRNRDSETMVWQKSNGTWKYLSSR